MDEAAPAGVFGCGLYIIDKTPSTVYDFRYHVEREALDDRQAKAISPQASHPDEGELALFRSPVDPGAKELSDAGCELCSLEAGGGPEGGWVYQDDNWSVGMSKGLEVPGWLTGQIRRHAVGTAALSQPEQDSLGPLLTRLTAAITHVTAAEKVYIVAFGEAFPHWHFLLMARGAEVESAHRGAALMLHREQYVDRAAAIATADQIRQVLSR